MYSDQTSMKTCKEISLFLFLYIKLHAASRLNFVTMIQKKTQNDTIKHTWNRLIPLIKTYKNEKKSSKFYLEFMLEKILAGM